MRGTTLANPTGGAAHLHEVPSAEKRGAICCSKCVVTTRWMSCVPGPYLKIRWSPPLAAAFRLTTVPAHLWSWQRRQVGNPTIANLLPPPNHAPALLGDPEEGRNRGLVTLTLTGKGDALGLYKACSSASRTKSVCMLRLTQANSTRGRLRKRKTKHGKPKPPKIPP